MDDNGYRTEGTPDRPGRGWNTETAAAALVLGALAFLLLTGRLFRGVTA